MRTELKELRKVMKQRGITVWWTPCSDAHGSEYIGERDQVVAFLSGFTGESCTLLVFDEDAFLWTDGRYFVQAERELRDSGVTLMKMGEAGVPTAEAFLSDRLKEGDRLGFYSPLLSAVRGEELREIAANAGAELRTDKDLIDIIWKDRPGRSCRPVWLHDERFAGRSASKKIKLLRTEMKRENCSVFLTSALDETAWLTNLRGGDIACNPVFLSYLILKPGSCALYLQKEALSAEAEQYLRLQKISVKNYDRFLKALTQLKGERILVDRAAVSDAVYAAIAENNTVVDRVSPVSLLKAAKSAEEIQGMRNCHLRDGVYMTRFLYWLHRTVRLQKESEITEMTASDYLDSLRAADSNYVSLSFPTISAYGENAAMCHYRATPETAAFLKPRGLYLVDSGAQYLDGTTDVTRTVALGETTAEERQDYTLAVIGMLRLLHAVFPQGIRGSNLDTYARQEMWRQGRDFNHGTGHGVGFLNNVHEMPVSVRRYPNPDARRDRPFVPGMVTSDEPGVYVEGSHGVRIENLICCVPHESYENFYRFETLTLVPLDPEPLEPGLMSDEDIRNYNDYQKLVRKTVGPLLTKEERDWLKNETRKIKRGEKREKKRGAKQK